jgi:Spy/CpxP family protein refolding chaperone
MRKQWVVTVGIFMLTQMAGPAVAERGHAMTGYEAGFGMHGRGQHQTAGHLFQHLLKHQKEIGLTPEQVTKLKGLQMDLTRTRIRLEADMKLAEAELAALADDEKTDLGSLEAKIKQTEASRTGLRMAVIKAKRDALAVLTPEQREKQKTAHEKMMMQMSRGHSVPDAMMQDKGEMGGASRHGFEHGSPPKDKKEEPKQ